MRASVGGVVFLGVFAALFLGLWFVMAAFRPNAALLLFLVGSTYAAAAVLAEGLRRVVKAVLEVNATLRALLPESPEVAARLHARSRAQPR